jgi:signal transduction histidine kinase
MGLYIAKKLIGRHNGRIYLNNSTKIQLGIKPHLNQVLLDNKQEGEK